VYEHVFAAIVTLHKPKTLHVVEEFHGSIGAFASRFALRASWCRITITATETSPIITARGAVTVKGWTVRTRFPLGHSHWLTVDDKISSRHLAATFHKLELKWLAFCKPGQTGLLNSTDMYENVVWTTVYLNEAKTFLAIEKFDNSFAGTDDLRRHRGATGPTTRGTKAASAASSTAAVTAAAISAAA
jgi:hypothetical protein